MEHIYIDERWISEKLLAEGLEILDESIRKIQWEPDNVRTEDWKLDDFLISFTIVHMLFDWYPYRDLIVILYDKYKSALKEVIREKVFTALENKHGTLFLRELVRLKQHYSNYAKDLKNLIFHSLELEVEAQNLITPRVRPLIRLSSHLFLRMICDRFFSRLDQALLVKFCSGSVIEDHERSNDDDDDDFDAKLMKANMNFFVKIYRMNAKLTSHGNCRPYKKKRRRSQ